MFYYSNPCLRCFFVKTVISELQVIIVFATEHAKTDNAS